MKIVALVLAASLTSVSAQSQTGTKATVRPPAPTAVQALTLTCAQAWAAAHKRYPEMLAIVTTLAKVSLANRDLTFPNTREVGVNAGRGIGEDCKADPDALLFAVVDKHVRRVAEATSH